MRVFLPRRVLNAKAAALQRAQSEMERLATEMESLGERLAEERGAPVPDADDDADDAALAVNPPASLLETNPHTRSGAALLRVCCTLIDFLVKPGPLL